MTLFATLAGETRARLLRLLRASSCSITELAEALGITDNAVRTHISALERDGLVRPTGSQRASGGKPARVYELTPAAEELFPKAYAEVLTEVFELLREQGGRERLVGFLRDVGRRIAARQPVGMDGKARVATAAELLESLGGSVRVEETAGGWLIAGDGCPLSRVVLAVPDVCALAEALVGEVTGLPVQERCNRSERPQCAFQVLNASGGGGCTAGAAGSGNAGSN